MRNKQCDSGENCGRKEAYLLKKSHGYRNDCLMSSRAMTNARMPLQIFQSIFILRQSARMFYLPRESLMHNYCLSKQIYTVAFFYVAVWLSLSLAESCQCVMCCDAAWMPTWLTEQQMDRAQWLVIEVPPLEDLAALFWACLVILVCLRHRVCVQVAKKANHLKSNQSSWTYTQQYSFFFPSCWFKILCHGM